MVVFIFLTIAFMMMMTLVCSLLAAGVKKDSLEYDLEHLWETYPADVRDQVRKSFE